MRNIDHFTGFPSITETGKNIANDLPKRKHFLKERKHIHVGNDNQRIMNMHISMKTKRERRKKRVEKQLYLDADGATRCLQRSEEREAINRA